MQELHNRYQESELKCDPDDTHPDIVALSDSKISKFQPSFLFQFWILLIRSIKGTVWLTLQQANITHIL